jgi:hypothetical protein
MHPVDAPRVAYEAGGETHGRAATSDATVSTAAPAAHFGPIAQNKIDTPGVRVTINPTAMSTK